MTEGPGGLIYGLEFQCRALSSVEGDNESVSFLVGTQSLKTTNQIHRVTVDEDSKTLTKSVFNHPAGEVWDICSSPKDPDVFLNRYSSLEGVSCQVKSKLWTTKVSSSQHGDDFDISSNRARELTLLCNIGKEDTIGDISHVSFKPGDDSKVMVLNENRLLLHDVCKLEENQHSTLISSGSLEGKGQTNLSTGAWNPHQNCQTFAAINEHIVHAWDVRSMGLAWTLENGGHQVIRSLDFNPNKQYHLLTGSDDGCLRFWDIRKTDKPLITRADHSHWIWCAKFNQFHDQLVLSSSSDCHVKLSCLASISSEPQGHVIEDEENEAKPKEMLSDGVLVSFEDHEESVYILAWSSTDPWTFASLSYDGRLVINNVPREAKFRILNLD